MTYAFRVKPQPTEKNPNPLFRRVLVLAPSFNDAEREVTRLHPTAERQDAAHPFKSDWQPDNRIDDEEVNLDSLPWRRAA